MSVFLLATVTSIHMTALLIYSLGKFIDINAEEMLLVEK
jgi:hypothetical protein